MAVLKYQDPVTGEWLPLAAVEQGEPGTPGTPGAPGEDGVGVPAGGTTDQVLAKNSGTDYDTKWATPASAGATSLDDLTDVVVSGPTADQILKYNGTNWANAAPPAGGGGGPVAIDDLTDVTLSSPSSTQVLTYNGTNWVNATPPSGGGGSGGTGVSVGTFVVAARDATAAQKAAADFVCPSTLADDALVIQSAINSAVPSGNSNFSIVLTQGKFQVKSPISLKSGTNLQGMGRDSTFIQVHSSFTGAAVFKLANTAVHATELGNFRIDGNNWAGTKVNGIWFNNGASGSASFSGVPDTSPDAVHYIHDIYIHYISGNGIVISQDALPTIKDSSFHVSDSRETVIFNTIVRKPGEHCYWLHQPDSRFISLGGSSAGRNYSAGSTTNPRPCLVLLGGNSRMTLCKMYSGNSHGYYFGKDCDRVQVTNCEAQDCGDHGFVIAGRHGVYNALSAETVGADTGEHSGGSPINPKVSGAYIAGYNNFISGKISLRDRDWGSATAHQYFALNFDSAAMGHGDNVVEFHCQLDGGTATSGLYTGTMSATWCRLTADTAALPRFWLNSVEKTWGVP